MVNEIKFDEKMLWAQIAIKGMIGIFFSHFLNAFSSLEASEVVFTSIIHSLTKNPTQVVKVNKESC